MSLVTAPKFWVPPRVAREEVAQSEEFKAQVLKVAQRLHGIMSYWTDRLRRDLNDDRLELIFWPQDAPHDAGLTPGRYHVVRHNEAPTPPTFKAIEGPQGEFIEPHAGIIEELRRSDLQNPQLMRRREENVRKAEAAKQREMQRDVEERHEHIKDAYKARFETSISLNRDTPWTQNAAGRRGRKS